MKRSVLSKERVLAALFLLLCFACTAYSGWRDQQDAVDAGLGEATRLAGVGEGLAALLFAGLSLAIIWVIYRGHDSPVSAIRHPRVEVIILVIYLAWLALVFTSEVRRLDYSRYALGYNELAQMVRRFVASSTVARWQLDGWVIARLNNTIINTVIQLLVPLAIFFCLGNKGKSLGFNFRGWWLVLPLAVPSVLMFLLKSGGEVNNWQQMPLMFLFNLFIVGLPREFWARGLLQSRLEKILSNPMAGILLASLIYGMMYLPGYTRQYGSDWVRVLVACLGKPALLGFLYGIVWSRTRSLVPGALWHALNTTLNLG